jgi:hypothetical protein
VELNVVSRVVIRMYSTEDAVWFAIRGNHLSNVTCGNGGRGARLLSTYRGYDTINLVEYAFKVKSIV